MRTTQKLLTQGLGALCLSLGIQSIASSETLTVTHWSTGMYGVPFAVALEKGYFSDAGLDIDGFMSSSGGGTTVRNAMASPIPYGEVALPAAIAAIRQGVPLTIVHGGVISLQDLIWVTRPDSGITSPEQLKGKAAGYSSPKSVTDMVLTIALQNANIIDQVDRKAIGSVSAGLAALRENMIDVVYTTEPMFSQEKAHYAIAFPSADHVPTVTQTVGVVRSDYLEKNPQIIKAIIDARRRGVEFIQDNPEETIEILARQYKLPKEVAASAMASVTHTDQPYWSPAKLDYQGMDAMLKGLILVNAIEDGPFDWSAVVNTSLLEPEEQ